MGRDIKDVPLTDFVRVMVVLLDGQIVGAAPHPQHVQEGRHDAIMAEFCEKQGLDKEELLASSMTIANRMEADMMARQPAQQPAAHFPSDIPAGLLEAMTEAINCGNPDCPVHGHLNTHDGQKRRQPVGFRLIPGGKGKPTIH